MGVFEEDSESEMIIGSSALKDYRRSLETRATDRSHDVGLLQFANSASNRTYAPRVHERIVDHIQDHPTIYKGLVTAAAIAIGMLAYGARKPEPDFMSAQDKAIMKEQIRLEKLYDSGVELKHFEDSDGVYHTVPASEYNAE